MKCTEKETNLLQGKGYLTVSNTHDYPVLGRESSPTTAQEF